MADLEEKIAKIYVRLMLQVPILFYLPACGSVIARAPTHFPAVMAGMNFSICSSVPYSAMYGMLMSLCIPKLDPT